MARVRSPFATSAQPVRVLSFAEAERAVKVKWEASRGWHVELWVRYPGAEKSRRVRVTWGSCPWGSPIGAPIQVIAYGDAQLELFAPGASGGTYRVLFDAWLQASNGQTIHSDLSGGIARVSGVYYEYEPGVPAPEPSGLFLLGLTALIGRRGRGSRSHPGRGPDALRPRADRTPVG